MTSLFISHASPDRSFALRLARSLEQLGHTAWVDAQAIPVGASIPRSVAEAAEGADYFIIVLSHHGVASSWCQHEWYAKYWDEVASWQTLVLPALLDDCPIPFFLRPKRFADFRGEYAVGLAQLALALDEHTRLARVDGTPRSLSQLPLSSTDPFCYADSMKYPGRLIELQVDIQIPYIGRVAGVWKPDEREQDAAWELYVELATRIAVVELPTDEGMLREGLSSLYGIFTTTRQVLRNYGPSVARPKRAGDLSFGFLAISVLNGVLRPVLAKWHPLLLDYEHRREGTVSPLQHEAAWERAAELRVAIRQAQAILIEYTHVLARITGVPMPTAA